MHDAVGEEDVLLQHAGSVNEQAVGGEPHSESPALVGAQDGSIEEAGTVIGRGPRDDVVA